MLTPKTISFSGKVLEKMKHEGLVDKAVLSELKDNAEKILNQPTLKVTERLVHADSGNLHDYASMGTCWWPNPDTDDGLPYVRRDGISNPVVVNEKMN